MGELLYSYRILRDWRANISQRSIYFGKAYVALPNK